MLSSASIAVAPHYFFLILRFSLYNLQYNSYLSISGVGGLSCRPVSPISLKSLMYFPMIAFFHWVMKILIISQRSLRWEVFILFYFRCNCEKSHRICVSLSLSLYMGCEIKSSECWWHFQILLHMLKLTPQTHGYCLPGGPIIVPLIGYSTNL